MTSHHINLRTRLCFTSGRHSEQGFALVVILIMLVVVTLLGVTGFHMASVEERLASHSRDQTAAFEAAEATLYIAELETTLAASTDYTTTCVSGLCRIGYAPDPSIYKWTNGAYTTVYISASGNMIDGNLAAPPKYIIECCVNTDPNLVQTGGVAFNPSVYRIIVHAQGYNQSTQVTLESFYTAKFR